jgi:HPt (histidine-containing phosphotransfer) domain-containing protein
VSDAESRILDAGVLDTLRDSVGGDDSFVAELVETYLGDAATQLAAIESALATGDAEALVRPAHTLKSASFTVGAMRLGGLSRELEMRGRSGRLDEGGDASVVRATWSETETALRAWLARDGSS